MSFADEIRSAIGAFRDEYISHSSVERLTNALELIADRLEREQPSVVHPLQIPIPQHPLRMVK